MKSSRIAVYSGTFDPVSLGHLDLVLRGRCLFDHLVIGVGENPEKDPLFSVQERVTLVTQLVSEYEDISVKSFRGLTVNFLKEVGATILLRGVRSLSDMDQEFTMALANQALHSEIETVFLTAREEYTHISSSLTKQIAQMGSKEDVAKFVPELIVEPLLRKLGKA